jgi:hypothetical protein
MKKSETRKAQMKIQEMAFVLLALVLLAVIGSIFFLRLSQSGLQKSAEQIREQTAISLMEKIANLPELECFCKPSCRSDCMDENKIGFFRTQMQTDKSLELLFQGLSNVRIVKIYPAGNDLQIYQSTTPSNASSYSTFINSCKYETSSPYIYDCSMAMIVARGT